MKRTFTRAAVALTMALAASIAPGIGGTYYPAEIPRKEKADFIFFTNEVFTNPDMEDLYFDYIKQFRVCLTNGYQNFEGEKLAELHAAGCELFIYRWFNGYYVRELGLAADVDEERVTIGNVELNVEDVYDDYYVRFPEMSNGFRTIHENRDWILNPDEPLKGAGAVLPAFFFDFNNPEFRRFFVEWIRNDLDESSYDGVFFDYIGGWALPGSVKAIWDEKYPDVSYNEASVQFLKELDEAIGDRKIFGNQAYRMDEPFYDHIDYDVSESYAVSFVWGKEAEANIEGDGMKTVNETWYRAWDGFGGYEETSRRRRAGGEDPRVEVFDINYLQPMHIPTGRVAAYGDLREIEYTKRTDRPAIFYGYAMSKLTGGESFASDWYCPGYGKDDIYFLDMGDSLDDNLTVERHALVRYFENGFIVATRESNMVRFEPDPDKIPGDVTGIWDIYEGVPVFDWNRTKSVTIHPEYYPLTESYYPSGRVYMYLRD